MSHVEFEEKIGYRFKDSKLLERALTHASKSVKHLERQEFLGDAVLGLVIAEFLFKHYPKSKEGDLSKMRANLVCKSALLKVAHVWNLNQYLFVGDGERDKGGLLKSESIAANAVEAVIGAVFEDGGFEAAKNFIAAHWASMLKMVEPINLRDAKSLLQELTQAQSMGLPVYKVTDLGVHHLPRFQAECFLGHEKLGVGLGQRKKEAEIKAAEQALLSSTIKTLRVN